MRVAVWPVQPARAFAEALLDEGVFSEVVEVEPFDMLTALRHEEAEVGLVPTLDVLRDELDLDLLPGVAFVGERSPNQVLNVVSPLDQINTVAFDPRYGQEVLLSQIVLKEHYSGKPSFKPVDPTTSAAERLALGDAGLVPPSDTIDGAVSLDLGQEWLELTLRPMVWGLMASLPDTIDVPTAIALREAVGQISAPEEARLQGELVYQFSFDGYAQDGLEEFIKHLYYHGTLDEIPDLSFIEIPDEEDEAAG